MSLMVAYNESYDEENGLTRICQGCGEKLPIGETWWAKNGDLVTENQHEVVDCVKALRSRIERLESDETD